MRGRPRSGRGGRRDSCRRASYRRRSRGRRPSACRRSPSSSSPPRRSATAARISGRRWRCSTSSRRSWLSMSGCAPRSSAPGPTGRPSSASVPASAAETAPFSGVDAHLVGQLVHVPRPPREMSSEHRAHLGHRVQQPVARALLPEVREHRVHESLPVDLPDPLVNPLVAQHGQLVVPHAHVDQDSVAARGSLHAEALEDRDRPRHRVSGAAMVEVDPDLRGGARFRRRDGLRHRLQIGLREEPAHPPRMTCHHQLPLEPPPPKLPPPPLNPPPLLPPPPLHPPPMPPPMKGPPQPDEPPVHPRRRSPACCMRFVTRAAIRKNTKRSASASRQPKPWVGCPRFGPGGRWYVPAMARSIASSPAPMPSATWPARKRGATTSRRMEEETASVRLPSSPYPTSMRIFRSSRNTRKMTPLSRPFWPMRQAFASRIE